MKFTVHNRKKHISIATQRERELLDRVFKELIEKRITAEYYLRVINRITVSELKKEYKKKYNDYLAISHNPLPSNVINKPYT